MEVVESVVDYLKAIDYLMGDGSLEGAKEGNMIRL